MKQRWGLPLLGLTARESSDLVVVPVLCPTWEAFPTSSEVVHHDWFHDFAAYESRIFFLGGWFPLEQHQAGSPGFRYVPVPVPRCRGQADSTQPGWCCCITFGLVAGVPSHQHGGTATSRAAQRAQRAWARPAAVRATRKCGNTKLRCTEGTAPWLRGMVNDGKARGVLGVGQLSSGTRFDPWGSVNMRWSSSRTWKNQ